MCWSESDGITRIGCDICREDIFRGREDDIDVNTVQSLTTESGQTIDCCPSCYAVMTSIALSRYAYDVTSELFSPRWQGLPIPLSSGLLRSIVKTTREQRAVQ